MYTYIDGSIFILINSSVLFSMSLHWSMDFTFSQVQMLQTNIWKTKKVLNTLKYVGTFLIL